MASSRECPECGRNRTLKTYPARAKRCQYCARKRASASRHATHIRQTYDLSPEEYAQLTANGCNVCGRPGTRRRLAVDHDHKVERERGIRASLRGALCKQHNNVLRDVRDDAALLRRLADYLDNPPAKRILRPPS
jgi:hypothetical protein